MEHSLAQKVRDRFKIPEEKETRWGIIAEQKDGEIKYRPALLFSCGKNLCAIDIINDRIITSFEGEDFNVKFLNADATADEHSLLLISLSGDYRVTLPTLRLSYFNKVYSTELEASIAAGGIFR